MHDRRASTSHLIHTHTRGTCTPSTATSANGGDPRVLRRPGRARHQGGDRGRGERATGGAGAARQDANLLPAAVMGMPPDPPWMALLRFDCDCCLPDLAATSPGAAEGAPARSAPPPPPSRLSPALRLAPRARAHAVFPAPPPRRRQKKHPAVMLSAPWAPPPGRFRHATRTSRRGVGAPSLARPAGAPGPYPPPPPSSLRL